MTTDSLASGALTATQQVSVRQQVAELFDLYEQRLFNYLLTLSSDPDTAADCLQATFLAAFEQINTGRTVNATWLYTVARNRAIDEGRYHTRVRSGLEADETREEQQGTRWSGALSDALARLAPEDRELLFLYDVDRLTAKEIGKVIGKRPGAVRMRVLRARESVRHLAGKDGQL